ncbi:MAG: inositol monophosphatase [Candidatus Brennerbacteria bacterium]|nr:inositol monophosphatase [Candidatus Brennerbacteria bacterium]
MNIKNIAIEAIKESGDVLKQLFGGSIKKYEMKNKLDILAEADLKSERIIIDCIKKNFPNHSILSEEKGEENNSSEFRWIIDPVDGTINFSRGIEEFCISIAVEQNKQLILGLIYNPLSDKLYSAEKGKGAYLNDKKINVSLEKQVINTILATDNSSNVEARIKNYEILSKICAQVRHIRILGSGALHLARIASGEIDAYYKTKFNYWDYGAGVLLVKEAGGEITDFSGNPISESSKNIVVSNKIIHDQILTLLK